MFHGARILVAPLDWGLGHATRCVPVIRRLVAHGATPIIAADRSPLALLAREFPELETVCLPGLTIRYSEGASQLWSMARQFPAMVRSVRQEQALFDRLRSDLRLDAVISDQRFGVRGGDLPSVLITHQVYPFTPFAQAALRKLNLRHMARFDRCWIMDEPEAPGLAGELSHGAHLPANTRYIGVHSRLSRPVHPPATRHRVVAVISGPEPQRTLFEQRLTEQLRDLPGQHLLVRGMPGAAGLERTGNLERISHLGSEELAEALTGADLVVSRSGYTTLMDLVTLGRSALIVPTPGQAEQEYLGLIHGRTGRFMVQAQAALDIARALDTLPPAPPVTRTDGTLLESALSDLAGLLR
jgi:predicted glycosyltransferase